MLRRYLKDHLMRTLKFLSIGVVIVLAAVFTYANTRHLSPTEKLKEVHLASFQINGDLTAHERTVLEKKLSQLRGVTACTINSTGRLASIIFYPDVISTGNIVTVLSNNNRLAISQRELAVSGGCPVQAVSASFDRFISVIDLRN
jgi:hypothetical protein